MKMLSVILSRQGEDDKVWNKLVASTRVALSEALPATTPNEYIVGWNPAGIVWVLEKVSDMFDYSALDDKLFTIGEEFAAGTWLIIEGEGHYA